MSHFSWFVRSSAVVVFCASFLVAPSVMAQTLAQQLSGKILLQVQQHGEAWYIDPVTQTRLFLGRPADAFAVMRAKGLGVRHQELARYLASRFPSRLSGRIVLDVESHGEAYYVLPGQLRGVSLGRPTDAFRAMRSYGLGITDADLARIPTAGAVPASPPVAASPASTTDAGVSAMERRTFDMINQRRVQVGLAPVVWNDMIANVARAHSADMATGKIPFSHEGFSSRVETIQVLIPLTLAGENVAYNDYPDPVQTAVDGWIASQGHRENIEKAAFNQSGMGIVKSGDGKYYFTQLFIHAQ